MRNCLVQYFRCPERFGQLVWVDEPGSSSGYFRFGSDSICFGTYHAKQADPVPAAALHDAFNEVVIKDGEVHLPFNPSQIMENLYHEAYASEWRSGPLSLISQFYYFLRPAMPVAVRRHLQKLYLSNWRQIPFPSWPVDCSVDHLVRNLLLLSVRASGEERVPFIWFWPEGSSSCALMTHDVETGAGYNYCPALMDMDDEFGVKASFQIIPEERYQVRSNVLNEIRRRGFEICVHDLNHDGHLFKSREQFLRRASRINQYGREFDAKGFRAAVLYRKQLWYDALEFEYDMSVPNVARLDPQRGGCCTVMPYFLNEILEIPVTTIQDYSLYNILNDYSIDVWKQQIEIIMQNHGCMSFIVHPDYVMKPKQIAVFRQLLGYLDKLRREKNVWISTPGEVNRWWRQRAAMRLVETAKGWKIEGHGSERARIAWASEQDGRLVVSLEADSSNCALAAQNPRPGC